MAGARRRFEFIGAKFCDGQGLFGVKFASVTEHLPNAADIGGYGLGVGV